MQVEQILDRYQANKMVEDLIKMHGLHSESVTVQRLFGGNSNLMLLYGGRVIGYFETQIRVDGRSYFKDMTFIPTENSHLIVSEVDAKREYWEGLINRMKGNKLELDPICEMLFENNSDKCKKS